MGAAVHAWVIDSIPTIFVTDEALDTAWAVAQGFVDTHAGLQPPTGLSAKCNLRTLVPESTSAKIDVVDEDNSLAALFGANPKDYTPLASTLEPDETGPSATYSKYVGLEYVGSAGERRRYSCIPGFAIGMRHPGQSEAFALDTGVTPVSDHPIVLDGRRCAVYRVERVDGSWQDLADAKRVWWGTLNGKGSQRLKTWSFSCLGPESWLGGTVGDRRFQDPIRAVPLLELTDQKVVMAGRLQIVKMDDLQTADGIVHEYTNAGVAAGYDDADADGYLVGATTYANVATAINNFIDDMIADASQGTSFDNAGNNIYFDTGVGSDGLTIDWSRDDDSYVDDSETYIRTAAALYLTLHQDVWLAMGYDPRLQNSDRDPVSNYEQYGRFKVSGFGPGYWDGAFFSASGRVMKMVEEQDFGATEEQDFTSLRRWPPLYPGGAVSFRQEPGQEFQLIQIDPVYMTASKSRPLMADPDDSSSPYSLGGGVGDVTAQGLIVLQGPYRRRGDEDQVDPLAGYAFELDRERREGRTVQVARVCWRESSDGSISTDSSGWPRLVIYEWLDPRLFHIDFRPFSGTWGGFRSPPPDAEAITALPLLAYEYSGEGDKLGHTIRRMMLSTGTVGAWYANAGLSTSKYGLGGGTAYLDVGDNDDGGTIPGDAEEHVLGLGVPASMVASEQVWEDVFAAVGQHLSRCKIVAVGVQSATKLLEQALAATGVAIGFSGGKFSPVDAWRFPTPVDATMTITQEDYGGTPRQSWRDLVPTQELRLWAPIDRIEVRANRDPVSGEIGDKLERASNDIGARGRSQHLVTKIDGSFLLDPSLAIIGGNWPLEVAQRWREGFAFWGARNTTVTLKLHYEVAKDTWPGDGVLLTEPWIIDQDGDYGTSVATGRVLDRTYDAAKGQIRLRVMLSAESEFRMWAPSAVVTRYDEQDLGSDYRLLCEDDHLGHRNGTYDVDGFAEPAWSSEGGDADIEIFQFDGSPAGPDSSTGGWTGGIYGTVSSVNGEDGNSYIVLDGALTGATFYRDRHSVVVLREHANQGAAWVKRWYAPICESDGTHSGGTAGEKFRGL